MPTFIKSLWTVYCDSARQATRGLRQNPTIIIGSIAAFFAFSLAIRIFGPMGFAGGMILGLCNVALISLYYSWIASTVERDKLNFGELWKLDSSMFFTVLSVAFVLWIITFIVQSLIQGLDVAWILQLVQLGMVLLFNCLAEVIYLNRVESLPALTEAARFTQDNWIEWYLPLLVLIMPLLILSPLQVLLSFSSSEPLLPSLTIVVSTSALAGSSSWPTQLLTIFLGVVLANWYMLFRAHLFKALESGKHRRR
ncbi:MAG: hypothetical protein K1X79_08745 [Oligoflexia bacterium]|nr:hypothetical protein [Oligoflexia bacterium]